MSFVDSYDEKTIESLKKHCDSYSPNRNLSKKVKTLLSRNNVLILENIENGLDVDISDFDSVIEDYFDGLEFSYHNYDDANVQKVKHKIGDFFRYMDSLNLKPSYKIEFVHNFFSHFDYRNDINESRGFYDLITLDSIRNSNIMKQYLSCVSYNDYANFAGRLYAYLENLDSLEQEKVHYVFRSSYETLIRFINNYDMDLSIYFSKFILSNLTKEELSIIFRTYSGCIESFFEKSSLEFIKMVMVMKNYVKKHIGRSEEFLDSVFVIFDRGRKSKIDLYRKLLVEYHDKYLNNVDDLEHDKLFNELLFYTLDCDSNLSGLVEYEVTNLESFHNEFIKEDEDMYVSAFGSRRIGFLKMKCGCFDKTKDKLNFYNTPNVKEAYLLSVYGIYLRQARFLYDKYGRFLDICEEEILESDRETFDKLKKICEIYKLDLNNAEVFNLFEQKFCDDLNGKDLEGMKDGLSFILLRSQIDDMYKNSFNKILFEPENGVVIKHVRGVPIIDPGVDFSMVVNAVNGVGDFFEIDNDFEKKYNTSRDGENQGICASFIDNQNLGVVALKGPLLGYDNLDLCPLQAMGIGDIYSETCAMSLKRSNSKTGEGNYFLTPKALTDYTRFGYNELVLDRFLRDDKNNVFKVQPSYVVVYKIDKNYTKTRMYKRGLRMAKEFKVPLILVDVVKVKENEKKIIMEMEDKLFSKRRVDCDLMKQIITRYMNNYSGSLTISRSRIEHGNFWNYENDFSEEGLRNFLDKLEEKMMSLTYAEIKEWNEAARKCYELELNKNILTDDIAEYSYSITSDEFFLKDIRFVDRCEKMTKKAIDKYLYDCGLTANGKSICIGKSPEVKTIIDLANFLYECSYLVIGEGNKKQAYMSHSADSLSEEEKEAYGLIISYLFGDYKENYFDNLCTCDKKKIKFYTKEKDFLDGINSGEFKDICQSQLLMSLATKIKEMDLMDLYDLFDPLIGKEREKAIVIKKTLVDRKYDIVNDFSKLPEKSKEKVKKRGGKNA